MTLEIHTVPCLQDNYAFLVHDDATGATAVVDVPDASAIETALAKKGWQLSEIWLTHHHWDHVDGVEPLVKSTGARVIGASADAHRLPKLDIAVSDGEIFDFAGETVRVLDVSGHTVGHIAFHLPGASAVFTADSLMALGCGRLFEGTPEQMWQSLSRLAALPDDTIVYSGHEYTETNARFALTIEPDNDALVQRVESVAEARRNNRPTVPSTLSEEKATNPFLRAHLQQVKANLDMSKRSDAEVFAEIRRRKDDF